MFELVSILLKWWKKIAIVCLAVGIITAAYSWFFMDNYYKSTVIFKPANPNMLDRSAVFPTEKAQSNFYMFGGKQDVDRTISIGESSALYGYIVNKYNLYDHYKISPTDPMRDFEVMKKFLGNYDIIKNALGAIEVSMSDKDPKIAADIANDIASKIDEQSREMIYSKKREMISIIEKQFAQVTNEMEALQDSARNVVIRKASDTLQIKILKELLNSKVSEYAELKQNLEENKALIEMPLPTLYYFEKAAPSIRKDRPKRSLIVIGSVIFTLLFMMIATVFIEKYEEFKEVT